MTKFPTIPANEAKRMLEAAGASCSFQAVGGGRVLYVSVRRPTGRVSTELATLESQGASVVFRASLDRVAAMVGVQIAEHA